MSSRAGYAATDATTLAMEQLQMSGLTRLDVTQDIESPLISADQPGKAHVYSKEELLSLRSIGVGKPKQLEDFAPKLKRNIPAKSTTKKLDAELPPTAPQPPFKCQTKEFEHLPSQSKDEETDGFQPEKPIDEAPTEKVHVEEANDFDGPFHDEPPAPTTRPSRILQFEEGDGPDRDPDDDEPNVNPELDTEVKVQRGSDVQQPEQQPEKKKRKKKSKSKSKANKPTGFEEYYTDPPITPQEYKEESQDLYSPARSFNERIELCIQRYRQKRNLDELRALVYTKYLALGGIDTGIKVGTGALSKADYEGADASQIAAYNATDTISAVQNSKYYNPADEENWVVDFTGIVKGFLSYRAPLLFRSSEPDEIKAWTTVIRNFLNYVLLHNVCPEYNEDIAQARNICNIADDEHPRICLISPSLPGDFNQACSTLYGGYYKGLTNTFIDPAAANPQLYMTEAEAQRIVMTGFAMMGSQELYIKVLEATPKKTKSGFRSMEVVEVIPATEETISAYKAVKNTLGEPGKLCPLGILKLTHWENPSALDEDLTEAEIANPDIIERYPDTEIWLEDFILEACFVGMKIEAVFHELDIGLTYFDTATNLHPSFYTFLENERMTYWKEPKPNERPPPMADEEDVDIDGVAAEDDEIECKN